jgi:hypothetical protein
MINWRAHLADILSKGAGHIAGPITGQRSEGGGGSAPPPSDIPDGFDTIKGHRIDFKHADKVDHVIGMLSAVKTTYHANGNTDLKPGHGHDAHKMAQDIAAGVLAEHGIVPKYANGGKHFLNAVDTTPDGTGLRLHYASRDPTEPGHAFSLRADGTLRYHGRTKHNASGGFSSPFGLNDHHPAAD